MSTAGPAEIAVLIIIAVLMFGPDKLPEMARKAARVYHYLKNIANNTRDQLRSELGPQFADLDYQDLKPQNFVRKYVLDGLQDDIDEIKSDLSDGPGVSARLQPAGALRHRGDLIRLANDPEKNWSPVSTDRGPVLRNG